MSDTIGRFWGPYRFLSNFWLADLYYPGRGVFTCAEAAFQAAKTDDPALWREFMELKPEQAKRLGRKIDLRPEWEFVKETEMRQILVFKFKTGSVLAQKLVDTYPKKLVEGNTWGDRYWGVSGGKGLNRLGELLMERRDVLLS